MNEQERQPRIRADQIAAAEALIGLSFTDEERELMREALSERLDAYEGLRAVSLDNAVPPALRFDPRAPGPSEAEAQKPLQTSALKDFERPSDEVELAFLPVTHLGHLLRTRQVTSIELTELYLERLKRYDPYLNCVVTLTEGLALGQARAADREIQEGAYRGPLHGVPWGAKDLLAVKGHPTTWGAAPFKDQRVELNATAVERLEAAGAVLLGKLSTGALAYGDVWFKATAKSPWDLEGGSSGSSAGPASAVAGGLCGFAIGSETLGSIVSPATRCGVTGLRPTFGRVSRFGAMALSWSMDKLGPMARSVEDCALVFDAIRGPDGRDATVVDRPFNWDASASLRDLRVGYVQSAFEQEREGKAHDDAALSALRGLGVELIPVDLPELPFDALRLILFAEAAAAFDALTRTDRDDELVRQDADAWPNLFRAARLAPAVEYVQANRVRTLAIEKMNALFDKIDVYVCPSFGADTLTLTNLTGHPAAVAPSGFAEGKPAASLTFTAGLDREADALLAAKAYQDATDFHRRRPAMGYA